LVLSNPNNTSANGAMANSYLKQTMLNSVAIPTERNTDGNIKEVFNIEVEDAHEYFANNILVHNCDTMAGLIHLIDNPDLPSLSFDIIAHQKPRRSESDKRRPVHSWLL